MAGKCIILSIVCALVCACGGAKRTDRVCGVPVDGCTPWGLAAAVADHGDGSFLPEQVQFCGESKAYICGWSISSEQPDTIICDLKEGKVVSAVIMSETE